MGTIGEKLKDRERQKDRERIARNSIILRKFVKEDLVAALEKGIEEGRNGSERVLAPKEIRHLFQGRLSYEDTLSIDNPNSAYREIWDELKAWMDAENLKLMVGEDMSNTRYSGTPWANKDWGGYLYISISKPEQELVKPTPPESRKAWQGATITMTEALWGIGLTALITFLITFFSIRH